MSMERRISDLVVPALAELGMELVDVTVGTSTLTFYVDRPGGVDLDAVTEATRAINQALDAAGPETRQRFSVEVSSPGVERSLRTPEQFRRFVGHTVAVKVRPGSSRPDLPRRLQGRLAAADESGIVVEAAAAPGPGPKTTSSAVRAELSEIDSARTVFDWAQAFRADGAAGGPVASAGKASATPGHRDGGGEGRSTR